MATKADLRNRALDHLGVKASGVEVSAEDAALVDGFIDSIQAGLDKTVPVFWDTSDIPERVLQPLSWIVAGEGLESFDPPPEKTARIERRVVEAKRELSRQTTLDMDQQPIRAIYY